MKILKMGNLNNYKHTCEYCNCEYEYDDSDVIMGVQLTMQYGYVHCPCCGKINYLMDYPMKKNYYYPYIDPLTMYSNSTQAVPCNLETARTSGYADCANHITTADVKDIDAKTITLHGSIAKEALDGNN